MPPLGCNRRHRSPIGAGIQEIPDAAAQHRVELGRQVRQRDQDEAAPVKPRVWDAKAVLRDHPVPEQQEIHVQGAGAPALCRTVAASFRLHLVGELHELPGLERGLHLHDLVAQGL